MGQLKQILHYIQRSQHKPTLENQVFNIASFTGGILLCVMALSNAFILTDKLAVIIPLIVSLALMVLFYFSRFQQKFIIAALLAIPLVYALSGVMWLINGGQSGSIIHGLQIFFLFFFAILPKKYHIPFTVFHLLSVISLYLIEYFHPNLITPYSSREEQLTDQIVTLTLSIICVYAIMMSIKRIYEEKTKEIQNQKEDLKELNDLKDKMLSIISHDIRGPLGQLKSVLSLVADGHISKEQSQDLLKKVFIDVQETENLLDSLVAWASIQLQERNIAIKEDLIELKPVIENEKNLFLNQIEQKKLVFSCQVPQQLYVSVNTNVLAFIIRNLFSNAVKFSNPGGEIQVSYIEKDKYIVLSVKDTGVGITPERLNEILDLNNNNSSTRGTNNEKGSGLGLRLCKEFIEKTGGTLHVESETGKGSTFFVSIPKNHH